MNQPLFMRLVEALGDLLEEPERAARVEGGFAGEQGAERLAFEPLHDEVEQVVREVFAVGEVSHRVLMPQHTHQLSLPTQALGARRRPEGRA